MATDAGRGQTALKAGNYPEAIKHLTIALKTSQSPIWLTQRSIAYHRNKQLDLALADAEAAVIAAQSRAKRELIATAQFRRAVALHGLGRFGDARMCLNWCQKMNEKETGLTIWIAKIKADYENAGGDDAECNKVTVQETPVIVKAVEGKGKEKEKENARPEEKQEAKVQAPEIKPTPIEKIRHDWYQSNASVTIDLLARGVPKDKVEVKFEERSVEVSFPVASSGNTFDFTLSPLYYAIDATKSSYRVTPQKIEITLSKSVSGLKWGSLEWNASHPTEPNAPNLNTTSDSTPSAIPASILAPTEDKAPAYPTSSKKGPKNWDKVDLEDDEKADGPEDFFKMLYKGSTPEQQRAMLKSYTESAGTSLSTNWGEVKDKTFVPEPPQGMEAKKW